MAVRGELRRSIGRENHFPFCGRTKRDFHGTGKSSSILSEKEGGLTLAIGGLHLSAREQQPF
jgi:hypothetical protein